MSGSVSSWRQLTGSGTIYDAAVSVDLDKTEPPADDKHARALQQLADAEQRRQQQRRLAEERKQPLPSHAVMVRYQKKVAMLSASSGQWFLQTALDEAAHPFAAARQGRLVSGRVFLDRPDGTCVKVRAYLEGQHAPSEIGDGDGGGGGSGVSDLFSSLGDDPISAAIALVLFVLMLIALPIVVFVWLRNRRRRNRVARRIVQGATPGGS
jgi:hypothetical protein